MLRPSQFLATAIVLVLLCRTGLFAEEADGKAQTPTSPASPAGGAAASGKAAPDVDKASIIEVDAERLAVAKLIADGENEAALVRVDQILASPLKDENERMSWLMIRSHVLRELGRPREAAEVRRSVQDWVLEQQAQAANQDPEGVWPAIEEDDALVLGIARALTCVILGTPLVLLVFGIHLSLSRQQSRIGRGSRARWLGVAAGCTVLGFLPLAIWGVAYLAAPGFARGATLGVAVSATVISNFALILVMPRPFALPDGRPLVDLESGLIVDRVAELSRRMNIAAPAVRRIRSVSSDLDAMGYMTGLPAYTLLISDGLEQRLTPEEQDAVLAHELGHIANGSLWWYAALAPISGSVAILLAVFAAAREVPTEALFTTLLMFGLTTSVGVKRLLGRALEYDSDRRAAKVAGASPMASALQKIYAIARVPESGLLSWMLHATAVHPSNDERIDALDEQAPITERVGVPWRKEEVTRRRWAFAVAVMFWLGILSVSGAMILDRDRSWGLLPDILLVATAIFPMLLQVLLYRRQTRVQRRHNSLRPRGRGLSLAIWLVAVAGLVWLVSTRGPYFLLPGLSNTEEAAFFSVCLLFAGSMLLLRFLFRRVLGVYAPTSLDRQILQHLLIGTYREALDLAAKYPKKVARSPISRHNLAVVKALAGDRAGAVRDLRAVMSQGIGPGQSILCLGSLLLDEDRPEEALEVARAFREFLPRDFAGPQLEGDALRALGRLDEAADRADEANRAEAAEKLPPREVKTRALQARIAIARGDLETAQRIIDEAERIAPGDFLLRVARFELAQKQGDDEAARTHFAGIQEFVTTTPISLYQKRLERMTPKETPEELSDIPAVAESL